MPSLRADAAGLMRPARSIPKFLMCTSPQWYTSVSYTHLTLSCHRMKKRIRKPTPMGIRILNKRVLFMVLKLPMSQKVIWGSLLSSSARSLMADVPDWNRVLTIIPPRTSPKTVSRLKRLVAAAAVSYTHLMLG